MRTIKEFREKNYEILTQLKMPGMLEAYMGQANNPNVSDMPFDQRFSSLLHAELSSRNKRRQQRLLKAAHFKDCMAQIDNLDWSEERHLNRSLIEELCECDWIDSERKPWVLLYGASGCGKSFLAQVVMGI